MTLPVLAVFLMLTASTGDRNSLQERLSCAGDDPEAARAVAIELRQAMIGRRAPIIEGDSVTFIYAGSTADKVTVSGDWTGRSTGTEMKALGSTGLRYLTVRFAPAACLEYKRAVNGKMVLDQANSRRCDNGIGGENNWFALPGYRAATIVELPALRRGRDEQFEFGSPPRRIRVHLPANYDQNVEARFPTLYLHDGDAYRLNVKAAQIADALADTGRIQSLILIFIPPLDRTKEYWRESGPFIQFMEALVPEIDRRYRTAMPREARATGGASLGGLIAIRLALARPDLFGAVLSQSGALHIDRQRLEQEIDGKSPPPPRIWMDWGTYESPLTEGCRSVSTVMKTRGWTVRSEERPTGHNWTAWRDRFGEALEWLWPAGAARRSHVEFD